jgi:hypothetical protein
MYTVLKCAAVAGALFAGWGCAQGADPGPSSLSGAAESLRSPIFGVVIPKGYRQWELVAVSYETAFDEFRGILGNSSAIMFSHSQKILMAPVRSRRSRCSAPTLPAPRSLTRWALFVSW